MNIKELKKLLINNKAILEAGQDPNEYNQGKIIFIRANGGLKNG